MMITILRRVLMPSLIVLLSISMASAGLAITEFVNNSEGEDSGREWVELFNYGPGAIDLAGWTFDDEDSDSVALPNYTIPMGGYMVLVNGSSDLTETQAKLVFEEEWLGGVADARVFGVTGIALGNGSDELLLKDNGATVWNIAYDNDENDDSTWLTLDDFSRTDWGQKGGPFIVRVGDDLDIPGLTGYERNTDTLDPLAWESDYLAVKDADFLTGIGLPIDTYDNVDNGSWGSPLAGHYTTIPEPATLSLLCLCCLALRRRS